MGGTGTAAQIQKAIPNRALLPVREQEQEQGQEQTRLLQETALLGLALAEGDLPGAEAPEGHYLGTVYSVAAHQDAVPSAEAAHPGAVRLEETGHPSEEDPLSEAGPLLGAGAAEAASPGAEAPGDANRG